MALIECPVCKKQISDKATTCPSCGFILNELTPTEKTVCPECGCETPDGAEVCPSCGCPLLNESNNNEKAPQKVEVTGVNLPKISKKRRNLIIISIILIILIIAGSVVGLNIKKKIEVDNYANNMKQASSTMLIGAASGETAGGLIHDVWYNTLYEEYDDSTDKYTTNGYYVFNDDFNDSLQSLFYDSSFQYTIDSIESNQESVKLLMKNLTNPPDQFLEAYTALKEYYNAYLILTNLVINPTGNLQSYTSDFNDAVSKTSNCYEAMQVYIK